MAPRAKTGKSRRGCRQCKVRRIKCDESEPECNNCSRRGLQCPGYQRGVRFSTKHERWCEVSACASDVHDEITLPTPASSRGSVDKKVLCEAPQEDSALGESSVVVAPQAAVDVYSGTAKSVGILTGSDAIVSQRWDDLLWPDDWSSILQSTDELEQFPAASAEELTPQSFTSANTALSRIEPSHDVSPRSAFFHTPIDLSSTLVEYWFSHVCPMWSAFDGSTNYNRQIPISTWTSSEPVFYALQAMSGACLADSMPQINSILPSLITQATSAIQRRISALHQPPTVPSININIDLLFAVFAMGTSMHWADASHVGDALLRDARDVLRLWATDLAAFDANHAMVHAYFHQALTWWNAMLSFIDEGSNHERLDDKRLKYQARLREAMQLGNTYTPPDLPELDDVFQPLENTRLHPWCGVSSEVIDVFGQVLALCRSSRIRCRKQNTPTFETSSTALADIGIARDLQRELLEMDFEAMVALDGLHGISLQTDDEKTPMSHLILTAEAYRLAALIQLSLTFNDVEVVRPVKEHPSVRTALAELTIEEDAPRAEKLVAMALQLSSVLEQIPADSGARCIHPVLLILAASGLRFDSNAQSPPVIIDHDAVINGFATPNSMNNGLLHTHTPFQTCLPGTVCPPLDQGKVITQASLEVSKARRFVRSRLRGLQETLPPRPIQVALELVDAIWAEYDGGRTGSSDAHWLDVMNDTGLKTLFG